ncbi:hypothetical protein [uncultured Bacteroides sp.]|uniref:hypothetical protein n=1 Tax=uncultured Bacteroides sp. TaxID=162156 RepID=UPI00263612B1|nr:hypothetical protein [uncultured Bacteroides sp.]
MKLGKYIAMMLLACATGYTFTSCSDDDSFGEAPRMFRPVASLQVSNNSIVVDWENIKGATSYTLDLYRVNGTDPVTGESTYDAEPYATGTCESAPYTFSDLNWDEKYMVKIKCSDGTRESAQYETKDVSVTYLTKLTNVKTIDNAARINWDEGGAQIKAIKVELQPEEEAVGGEDTPATQAEGDATDENTFVVEVSEDEYNAGYVDIMNLLSERTYRFYAYSDSEVLDNSTYAGRLSGTTTAPEDFDASYGAGNWLDIRSWDESAKDTLSTDDFWALVNDGMTVILRGDFEYNVGSDVKFSKSVTFRTGATLGGNARFLSGGGMQCEKGATVDKISFQNIDFYAKGWQPGGDNSVATCKKWGFSGKQVFNESGTGSTLGTIEFKKCHIEGYRAIVRTQKDNDNIGNIIFDGCTINGIGDQGICTTSNKKADWGTITMKDCTVTNIVFFGDFRATANPLTINVESCTFCYAPMETTANGNTPLFRFQKNAVSLNVTKTLFGPSMATEGSAGSKILPNQAGTAGSIFLDASNATINVNSFKTTWGWTPIGDNAKTYPLDGLQELNLTETQLWQDPANGNFTIIANLPESDLGASTWRSE